MYFWGVDGRLEVGDEIVAVNSKSLQKLKHSDAVYLLKTEGPQVILTIRSNPVLRGGHINLIHFHLHCHPLQICLLKMHQKTHSFIPVMTEMKNTGHSHKVGAKKLINKLAGHIMSGKKSLSIRCIQVLLILSSKYNLITRFTEASSVWWYN